MRVMAKGEPRFLFATTKSLQKPHDVTLFLQRLTYVDSFSKVQNPELITTDTQNDSGLKQRKCYN